MASKVAIEMKWESMAQVLVSVFPELREPYEELLARWTAYDDTDFDTARTLDPQYADEDEFNVAVELGDVPGNHVVYGDIFTHYLILLLGGPKKNHYLKSLLHFRPPPLIFRPTERKRRINEALDFLEGMCLNEDVRVQEVAVVTVLEYINGSRVLLALAKPHMGTVLLKELKQLQDGLEEAGRKYRESTSGEQTPARRLDTKPTACDPELQRVVDELYGPENTNAARWANRVVWKWIKGVFWTLALSVLALLLVVELAARFGSSSYPNIVDYRGQFPASLVEEVDGIVRHSASKRNLHVDGIEVSTARTAPFDGLPSFSLWLRPDDLRAAPILMAVSRFGTELKMSTSERGTAEAAWTMAEHDALVAEVLGRLEDELGLSLCDIDPVGVCSQPAEPRLLYRMDITGRSDRSRRHPLYDLADRHGIRVFVAPTGLAETTGVKGALAAYFYPDRRALNRGEFPLVVATGKASELLFLQAFDRGGMSADRVDALAFDAKTTLALHYGRPFCRADPATGRCDTAYAEREGEREAWLRAQGGDDPAAIEAFLAERPESPFAGAARERAAWLRRMSARPPSAPLAPAAQWVGRRPGETFADRLPDGSAAPRMTVVPAGAYRMGCTAAVGCPLQELPVHAVRVAWLSEMTGAEYRLPSEAEWEYAARASTATAYPWGDGMESGRARCYDCLGQEPDGFDPFGNPIGPVWVSTVGSYPANGWGFHDMHGNAAEWTADCWHPDHLEAPPDAATRTGGDCSRRVVRGGSYDSPADAVRSASRKGLPAGGRYMDVGFRVLRELRNAPPFE